MTFFYNPYFESEHKYWDISFTLLREKFDRELCLDFYEHNLLEKKIKTLLQIRDKFNLLIPKGNITIRSQKTFRRLIQKKLVILLCLAKRREECIKAALDLIINFQNTPSASWAHYFLRLHKLLPCQDSQKIPNLSCLALDSIDNDYLKNIVDIHQFPFYFAVHSCLFHQ